MRTALLACIATAIFTLALCLHLALADPKPLQLTVRPAIGFEPQDLFLIIRTPVLEDRDRTLAIALTGGLFYRESDIPLNGSASPPLHSFWYKQVPAGEYVVRASLGDCCDYWRAQASAHVTILPR